MEAFYVLYFALFLAGVSLLLLPVGLKVGGDVGGALADTGWLLLGGAGFLAVTFAAINWGTW